MKKNVHVWMVLVSLVGTLTLNFRSEGQNKNIHCPDTIKINSYLTIYGFSYDEMDTALVRLYRKNTKFKEKTDSFYVYTTHDIVNEAENNKRFINVGETRPITNAEDWEVVLANGKYVYRISDVKVAMKVVRHSLYLCQLESYRLNGKEFVADGISFSKPAAKTKKVPHN